MRVFLMPEMRVAHTLDHGETVNSIAFTSDDKLMATAGDNAEVRVWTTSDMKLQRTLRNVPGAGFVTVRFSPDDKTLAASGFEGHVSVWSVADGKRVGRFNYTGRKVEAVEFSRDGRFLVVGGHDRCIRMFRTSDFTLAYATEPTDNVEYVSFSPNGAFLVSAHQDGIVRLWRVMSDDP
ncbi:MAG: WD40 repeat domain-containing protein, partial [Pyrinomonadaceae bacterium]